MFCGVGRIYQQTFIDTYSKVAAAKRSTTRARRSNIRRRTGSASAFRRPSCMSFTVSHSVERCIPALPSCSAARCVGEEYNEVRPHQGRWCCGKTPMQTWLDSVALAKDKQTD
jgi:hypothetical protein